MVQEPGTPVQPEPTLAERETLARQALEDTEMRLDDIAERLRIIERDLDLLAESPMEELDAVHAADARATRQHDAIRGAKARLLIAVGTPGVASAQAALEAAERALAEAETGAKAGIVRFEAAKARAEAQIDVLVAERAALTAEQSPLAELVSHLQSEAQAACEAQGAALLEAAHAEVARLLAAQDEARAWLSEAEAAVAAHRAQTAEQLAA
jgi:hypothetical protein